MADTTLSPTGLVQIEVGASQDSWGGKLNDNAAILNALFSNVGDNPVLKEGAGGTGSAAGGLVEGSWTPEFNFQTPGTSSFAYGTQYGRYQRIGAWVHLDFVVQANVTKGTAAGDFYIIGIPFNFASSSAVNAAGGVISSFASAFMGWSGGLALGGYTTAAIRPVYTPTAGGTTGLAAANIPASGSLLIAGSIRYRVA